MPLESGATRQVLPRDATAQTRAATDKESLPAPTHVQLDHTGASRSELAKARVGDLGDEAAEIGVVESVEQVGAKTGGEPARGW